MIEAKLTEKVALITGGSSGIGKATAELFVREGALVVINGRFKEALESAADDVARVGKRPLTVPGDVSKKDNVKAMFKKVIRAFGKLDILVNSAGVCRLGPLDAFDVSDWDEQMATNVRGTFLCCQEAARQMIAQKERGQIINIASYMGIIGYPTVSSYCASKHAVMGFTKAIAKELRIKGIRVSAICPRQVDTKMRRDLFPESDSSSWLSPVEIAEQILFVVTRPFMAGIPELVIGLPQTY